jgi:hypothetical protein
LLHTFFSNTFSCNIYIFFTFWFIFQSL